MWRQRETNTHQPETTTTGTEERLWTSNENNEKTPSTDSEEKPLRGNYRVRRLDPEALRDAILASAGELDLGRVDSTVAYLGDQATAVGANKVRRRTDFPNRSVFLPVIRNDLPELFEAFDFADPHIATGARDIYAATDAIFDRGIRFMPPPPPAYYQLSKTRVEGHEEPLDAMKKHGILIDGEGVVDGGETRILLQIFSKTVIGPIFFEFIQRKGDDGFGEGNFRALFESIEAEELAKGEYGDFAAE